MRGSIAAILLTLALTGCSKPEAEKPAGVLPAYQQQALQDAKAVEGMLGDVDARRRAELEQVE